MERACDSCGEVYEAKRKTSRWCSERCRKRGQRGAVRVLPAVPAEESKTEPFSVTLVRSTEQQLRDAGRLESWLGQHAVALAARISAGKDTSSGLAALSREFRTTMQEALRGADASGSAVLRHRDELAARRAKAQGA